MGRWTRRRIATLGVLVGACLMLMGCDGDEVSQVLRGAVAADQPPPAEAAEPSTTTARDGVAADVAAIERQVATLLDRARRRDGRAALTRRRGISNGAREWACGMAQSGNFRHADLRTAGVYGENIAWGQRSASEVHTAWMDSLGHRTNRMGDRWTEYGIGVCRGGDGTLYFTERFR